MSNVPEAVESSLRSYVRKHQPVGGFLRAVLSNDLREAVMLADPENLSVIRDIVSYCHWEMPSKCWGSKVAYQKWVGIVSEAEGES